MDIRIEYLTDNYEGLYTNESQASSFKTKLEFDYLCKYYIHNLKVDYSNSIGSSVIIYLIEYIDEYSCKKTYIYSANNYSHKVKESSHPKLDEMLNKLCDELI